MEEDIKLGDESGASAPLDHGAQKARGLLAHRGSLGKRRKPSRDSLHTLLTSVSWDASADDVTSGGRCGDGMSKTSVSLADVNGTGVQTAATKSSSSNVADLRSRVDAPRVTTVRIKGRPAPSPSSPGGRRITVDVETKLHRRDPSLDSGCGLDHSDAAPDSASSGKGSPDPALSRATPYEETLSPPAEFADSLPATPRLPRQDGTGHSSRTRTMDNLEANGYKPSQSKGVTSNTAEIRVNFRILPGASAPVQRSAGVPAASDPASSAAVASPAKAPVVRSESVRVGGLQTWDSRRPPRLDSERRCRSLSRGSAVMPDEADEQPEWMRIALQKQKSRVDWENFEAHMKEPHSISCTNLSESHMRDRVTALGPAGPKPLLTRSVSAVYPRIKMSRFERRMRREARNPSPERKLSEDFNVVSDSTLSSGTGSSSTEDEKPSFLNVQLRHVERTPPLNVVYQTSSKRTPGEVSAASSPAASRRSLKSPCDSGDVVEVTRWRKTSQECHQGREGPRVNGVEERSEAGAVGDRPKSQLQRGSDFLQPKPVELVEDTPRHKTTAPADARLTQNESPVPLRRSSSVQMRTKVPESSIARRSTLWQEHAQDGELPSWIREAERKRNSGIDWDRLDQSLSHAANCSAASMSTECLRGPVDESADEPVLPAWLRLIRQRREGKQAKTQQVSEESGEKDRISACTPETPKVGATDAVKDRQHKAERTNSITVETMIETASRRNAVGKDVLRTLHTTSTDEALDEQGDHTPRIVDVKPKERAKTSKRALAESCAKLLDEIFSEAEGTEDERPANGRAESNESEDVSDSEKHVHKQALMLELKCALKKRSSQETLSSTAAITGPDSDEPQTEAARSRSAGGSVLRENGFLPPDNTYPKPSEIRAFSFPPPPPVFPSDNQSFQQQEPSKMSQARRDRGPRRDSETQTADEAVLPDEQSSQGLQEAVEPPPKAAACGHQLVSHSTGQLLIFDGTGLLRTQQAVSLYAVPTCHPVYSQHSSTPSEVELYADNIHLVSAAEAVEKDHIYSSPVISTAEVVEKQHVYSLPLKSRSVTPTPKKAFLTGRPHSCSPVGKKPETDEAELLQNGHGEELRFNTKAFTLSDSVKGSHREIERLLNDGGGGKESKPSEGLQQSHREIQTLSNGTYDKCPDRSEDGAVSEASSTIIREQKKAVSSIMEALIPYMDADDLSEVGSFAPTTEIDPMVEKRLVAERCNQDNNAVSLQCSLDVNGVAKEERSGLESPDKSREERSETEHSASSDGGRDAGKSCDELSDRADEEQPLNVARRGGKQHNGVTLVSSTSTVPRIRLLSTAALRESGRKQNQTSTVTTGPDGTVRGSHTKTGICPSVTDATPRRDERYSLFKKTKSHSVPNLLSATDIPKQRKKTVSASTQTPNGILFQNNRVVDENTGTGKTRGVQTDVGSKLKVRRSARDVEVVTKVDSSSPSKTLRKKITTKIVRNSNGKTGGVREVVEEYYDQSSVTVRPFGTSKGVSRSVKQASDGRKYLATVITDAEMPSVRHRRSHRRDKDHDGHVIMV